MDVGRRVRELRIRRGLVIEDGARKTGLAKPYISQVETGKASPSLQTVQKLAQALGVPHDAKRGPRPQPDRGGHGAGGARAHRRGGAAPAAPRARRRAGGVAPRPAYPVGIRGAQHPPPALDQ